MLLNFGKCKCIYIGHGNMDEEYKMGDAVLGRTTQEKDLRNLSYESCLLQCGLTTLETRRLRGDQIEVFKIVNGDEDVDRNMFFKIKEGSRTSGHKAALVKEQCRLARESTLSHRG